MASDDVVVRFGGSIEGLTAAVEGARAAIEGLAEPFVGLQSSFVGLGEALAAAFAVEALFRRSGIRLTESLLYWAPSGASRRLAAAIMAGWGSLSGGMNSCRSHPPPSAL